MAQTFTFLMPVEALFLFHCNSLFHGNAVAGNSTLLGHTVKSTLFFRYVFPA